LICNKKEEECIGWVCFTCRSLLVAPFSYADEDEQPMIIKTVSGKVNKTDWVGSTMIVRWFQPNGNYDEDLG